MVFYCYLLEEYKVYFKLHFKNQLNILFYLRWEIQNILTIDSQHQSHFQPKVIHVQIHLRR